MPEILPVSTEANVYGGTPPAGSGTQRPCCSGPAGRLDRAGQYGAHAACAASGSNPELRTRSDYHKTKPLARAARQLGIPVFRNTRTIPKCKLANAPTPHRPSTHKRLAAACPNPHLWQRADIVAHTTQPRLRQARQRRIQIEELKRRPLPFWLQIDRLSLYGSGSCRSTLVFCAVRAAGSHDHAWCLDASPFPLPSSLPPILAWMPPDVDANLLPGRLVEMTMDETGTIATSGSQQKPTDNATGSVVFNNLGNSPVEIPVGHHCQHEHRHSDHLSHHDSGDGWKAVSGRA